MNFWNVLKKPIMILAPMDGVTDTVFRQIVAGAGKPDVLFTEFVPVDAILSSRADAVIRRSLQFSKIEHPIVAQIWGTDPEKFYKSAKILKSLGFDGIDINMGCPDRSTIKKGACSALIKNTKLAQKIIMATISGAQFPGSKIPVSVKTRIGYEMLDTQNWVRSLLITPIDALTLHLRTVSEMSKTPAHWEEIEKALKVRDELKSNTLIIGNGDIKTLSQAKGKCKIHKIDGVMIGRGIFENVFLFNKGVNPESITPKKKIRLLLKHLNLFQKTYGEDRHFELMKKFVKCYVNNFKGSKEAREILMKTKKLDELIQKTRILNLTI